MDELGNSQYSSLEISDNQLPVSNQCQESVTPVSLSHKVLSQSNATLNTPKQGAPYNSNSHKVLGSAIGSTYLRFGNGNGKNTRLHRTVSLESSGSDIRVTPISSIQNNSDADTEDEEEENNNQVLNGSERINCGIRLKRSHQRYASRSLPVTPRVNGNCAMVQTPNANGVISSPYISGIGASSTPLLMAPHLAPHLSLEGSFNSIRSLSPNSSQYVTCTSGFLSETQEKVLPGSIDYSSLPLPKDDAFRTSHRKNISRHMSEPSIHEIPNNSLSTTGKCHSCPQRKNTLKSRRRADSEMSCGSLQSNNFRSSAGEFEPKLEDTDGVEMQWQFIRTLVNELNTTRSQNNRVSVELHQAKLEIQMLKATLNSYSEAGVQPGLVAEMVGQIHAAQKMRDEAMMSRIKLANEERDAAMAQTRSLLEKLGLSPRAPIDNSGIFSLRDHSIFSTPLSRNEDCTSGASLEEEFKALKMAFNIQDSLQDKCCNKDSGNIRGQPLEVFEELKTKLNDSEVSRVQLQDRCSKLERVFSGMRRKINGLNSAEASSVNPTNLTFLDMTLLGSSEFGSSSDAASLTSQVTSISRNQKRNSSSSSSCKMSQNESFPKLERLCNVSEPYHNAEAFSEGDCKDSSLESVETSSSSSWKPPKDQDQQPHPYDSSSSHSTMGSHSTLTPPSPHSPHVDLSTRILNCGNRGGDCEGSLSSHYDHCNDKDGSITQTANEYKSRNFGGVVMGPITEL